MKQTNKMRTDDLGICLMISSEPSRDRVTGIGIALCDQGKQCFFCSF